jgi:hypothetical protein
MSFMERAFAGHPLWAGCSREDLDAAVEVLPSLKLHYENFMEFFYSYVIHNF